MISQSPPVVGVVMGSTTDWKTMKAVSERLLSFGVAHESRVVSAHRTPDLLFEYARDARSRGIKILIAGAGGAAHLPGMLASNTTLPVLGVPIPSTLLNGIDSLLSIVQMPKGIPVGTLAIGDPGCRKRRPPGYPDSGALRPGSRPKTGGFPEVPAPEGIGE